MSIPEVVKGRGIQEVVHFTTSPGLLGILDAGVVLSRPRVREEQRLEFIVELNCPILKDPAWADYVNLSISEINNDLFQISATRWHPDLWWAILAFDPTILSHGDVFFTTTNNIYPAVLRGTGEAALEAMFAGRVAGKYAQPMDRWPGMPPYLTTDERAEVLYPRQLSVDHLKRIYVSTVEHEDAVHAHLGLVGRKAIPVTADPQRFLPRKTGQL